MADYVLNQGQGVPRAMQTRYRDMGDGVVRAGMEYAACGLADRRVDAAGAGLHRIEGDFIRLSWTTV